MKPFLVTVFRNALSMLCVLVMALPVCAQSAERVRTIKSVEWRRPHPHDSVSIKTRQLLALCCRYTLNTWRNNMLVVKHGAHSEARLNSDMVSNRRVESERFAQQGGWYLDFGGIQEKHIRPVSHEAFVLALSLKLKVCKPVVTGVSRKEAFCFAERLIASMACRHKANCGDKGWGDQWQSALWAAQGAEAAWFLWDKLSPDTRQMVLNMLVHEADRFIGYKVPYYRDKTGRIVSPGDTKTEENAWNSNILTIACDMLPHHPHWQSWFVKNRELQISAYARPSDLKRDTTIDGVRVFDLLQGSNMNEDGTVVNHNRIHPDYMVAFMHNATNALLDRLAGKAPLACSTFNGDIVYQALTHLPLGKEHHTIYCRDEKGRATSEMYYPEGNDWGTGRQANYWLMDVLAHVFHFDGRVNPVAYQWATARIDTMLAKMVKSSNGRYYSSKKENSFDTAEEFFAAQIAWGYLALWLESE